MNLVTQLIEAVDKQHKTIVVIGDVMVDHWVYGRIEDCQDGCKKFVHDYYYQTPGGAANAQRCIGKWNVGTLLFGQDERDMPNKWRFLDGNKIVFRYDKENNLGAHTNMTNFGHIIKDADGVLLCDYDKGYLSPDVIREVIQQCRTYKVPCVVDAKREPSLYEGAIVKGNHDWFNKYEFADVITLGFSSPVVRNAPAVRWANWPKLPSVPCVNHVGAGDCFSAHFILALAYGFSLPDAAVIAHSSGRVYVQHPHNRPPLPSEVEADFALSNTEATHV